MQHFSYCLWDGTDIQYHFFENNQGQTYEKL